MTKRPAKKTVKSQTKKVDYEPNKMAFAVAAMAVVTLLLLGVIAMF